jgi:fibrillarin-like pre-rRNA processing protein
MKEKKLKFPNMAVVKRKLYVKGSSSFFGEALTTIDGSKYRYFDAARSKLAAAVMKGISQIGLKEGDVVLYLGASHGYTPSFVSDMIRGSEEDGFIFAVDHAPRVVRDLVLLCEKRSNMCPVLADANNPEKLAPHVSQVDFVYQDIAQRNQTEIFLKNCRLFLKQGGFGFLCVKARSIDVTRKPKEIYKDVRKKLEREITIVDYRELDPFEKDHAVFVCKKK